MVWLQKSSAQFADTHTQSHTVTHKDSVLHIESVHASGHFYFAIQIPTSPQTNVLTAVSLYKLLEAEVCLKYISMSVSACSSSSLPREIYGNFHFGCFENGALLGAILSDGRMNVEPIDRPHPHHLKLCVSFSNVCSHWLLCADRGTPILSDWESQSRSSPPSPPPAQWNFPLQ